MAFYSYLSTKIIIAFITKSYQDLFGVRSYINAEKIAYPYDIDYTPPSKTFIYSFSIQYYKYFHFQFYLCTEQMPN